MMWNGCKRLFHSLLYGRSNNLRKVGHLVISEKMYIEIQLYLERHYNLNASTFNEPLVMEDACHSPRIIHKHMDKMLEISNESSIDIDLIVENIGETFSEMMLRLIDEKNLTDPYIYKKANVSKQTFNKIKNIPGYTPKKATVISLALALEMDLDEVECFLESAGYALRDNTRFDLIIRYFIEHQIYDIMKINEVLFKFEEPLLSS